MELSDLFHKYFDLSEFDCDYEPGSGKHMKPEFLNKLAVARDIAGIPFVVTSGIRTLKKNKDLIKAGYPAVLDSAHLITKGVGADIKSNPKTRFIIVAALIKAGFVRIGVANGFIHVDDDTTKPQQRLWTY